MQWHCVTVRSQVGDIPSTWVRSSHSCKSCVRMTLSRLRARPWVKVFIIKQIEDNSLLSCSLNLFQGANDSRSRLYGKLSNTVYLHFCKVLNMSSRLSSDATSSSSDQRKSHFKQRAAKNAGHPPTRANRKSVANKKKMPLKRLCHLSAPFSCWA